ncbi:hypothetical protein [Nostoc sp.]|uniref:hypothetical protein n=1 Tax=Nostoc sp. TaxID=1180 RepID=UPI002FFC2B2E
MGEGETRLGQVGKLQGSTGSIFRFVTGFKYLNLFIELGKRILFKTQSARQKVPLLEKYEFIYGVSFLPDGTLEFIQYFISGFPSAFYLLMALSLWIEQM